MKRLLLGLAWAVLSLPAFGQYAVYTKPPVVDTSTLTAPTLTAPVTITGAAGSTPLTITGGTQTADFPVIVGSQTWNNAAVAFNADVIDITSTASAAASTVINRKVGGSSVFSVSKAGAGTLASSLALGGATIGSNALAVTGTSQFSGNISFAVSNIVNIGTSSADRAAAIWATNSFASNSFQLGSSSDVILTRAAAATLQHGAADAASPVAQTITAQSVVAGTSNASAPNLTWAAPKGTGTGTGGSHIFQVSPAGGAGSSQNALSTVMLINASSNVGINTGGTTPQAPLHVVTAGQSYGQISFGVNGGGIIDAYGSGSIQIRNGGAAGLTVATTGIAALSGTAIPAGGSNSVGYKLTSTSNFGVFVGSGAPTLSAAQGSLYLRSDGSSTSTRAYINSDGGTTWTALTTGSWRYVCANPADLDIKQVAMPARRIFNHAANDRCFRKAA